MSYGAFWFILHPSSFILSRRSGSEMDRVELNELAEKERSSWKNVRVHCCTASGCVAADSLNVEKSLRQAVADRKLGDRVQVVGVGCLGLCGCGPLVEVASNARAGSGGGELYEKVTPADAPSIIAALDGGSAVPAKLDQSH